MKNSELWESYSDYTKILTETARKLGFAAAAICWFFKAPDNSFPSHILIALGFVVLYFISDMLQFLFGAIVLRFWTRSKEKKMCRETGTIEGDYKKPAWLDYPSFTLWWIKVVCLLLGFLFIGVHLLSLSV